MSGASWAQLSSSSTVAHGWHLGPSTSRTVLRCDASTRVTTLAEHGRARRTWDDPLDALRWMQDSLLDPDTSSGARWIGYLGYDAGALFEVLPARAADDVRLPLFVFSLHQPGEPAREPAMSLPVATRGLSSTFTRAAYEDAVARSIEYVAAGDVFQVNLSQRYTCGLTAQPVEVFDRLQSAAPARYGACLVYDDFAIVSNSPELFLRVEPQPDGSRRVTTRPIKGTRPRGPGMEAALRESGKDQAELAMIVDLERNDLGRVCEVASVRVVQPREIEAHPTVYHGVATVEGTLRQDTSFVDLLAATFPCGSVTGAPKIRAMQIIDELEPVRRGPYCGGIGYLAADGSAQFNVAIRTMFAKDGLIHIPVGGGIVADSQPAAEYEETLVKARAMFAALGIPVEVATR